MESSNANSLLTDEDHKQIKAIQDIWFGSDDWDRHTSVPGHLMKKWFMTDPDLDKQLTDQF